MVIEPTLQDHIDFFLGVQKWADTNGYGNEHAMLTRIIRDLTSLRILPDEAFATPELPDAPVVEDMRTHQSGVQVDRLIDKGPEGEVGYQYSDD